MVEFLTTNAILHRLEEMITQTTKLLTLVSPFIKLEFTFLERLINLGKKGIPIRLVFGKESLNDTEYDKLKQIPNVALFFYQELHAKCYFNEQALILGSFNLYEFSEKNREVGIYVDRNQSSDEKVFYDAIREMDDIINAAKPIALTELRAEINTQSDLKSKDLPSRMGVCIRCGKSIPMNIYHPYCPHCFSNWTHVSVKTMPEKYCHYCGKVDKISYQNPLCASCRKMTTQRTDYYA